MTIHPQAQQRVQAVIDDLVARDVESGLQVAAYLDGDLVVDAWAGLADVSARRPVDGETLFCVFSCGKGITATVIHMLVDRGLLDYDAPVARYWPAFGAHGKDRILVRHALAHTAGIPQVPPGIGPAELGDWGRVCRGVEALEPLWEPGTQTGYHALTHGWILGELARRADGRDFARIVREDLCAPLGIESMYFGIPDQVEPRVALLEPSFPRPDDPPPSELALRVVPPAFSPLGVAFNRPDVRRACVPAAGGIMNARALARHYAALVSGELDGARLLSAETLRRATTLETDAIDLVGEVRYYKALGYFLGPADPTQGYRPSAFGHSGAGGNSGFADPDYRFAFALAKTRMLDLPDEEGAATAVARAARAALGIPEGSPPA